MSDIREMIQLAPEARQKVARGKRLARRPWVTPTPGPALKGRKKPGETESRELLKRLPRLNTTSATFGDAWCAL